MTAGKESNIGTVRVVCHALDAHAGLGSRRNVDPKQTQTVSHVGLGTIILTPPDLKAVSCKSVKVLKTYNFARIHF